MVVLMSVCMVVIVDVSVVTRRSGVEKTRLGAFLCRRGRERSSDKDTWCWLQTDNSTYEAKMLRMACRG